MAVYQMFIRSPRPPTPDRMVKTTVLPKKIDDLKFLEHLGRI